MIGIRREDKSRWEARAPLTPANVRQLATRDGLAFEVQRSEFRRFSEADYIAAGAQLVDTLAACPIILGVKEIPVAALEPRKTYMFFSHTIKAQPANMPMLRRLLDLDCTLIDYERIVDAQGRRLVFFGRFAGLAGMIDGLWALGRRLRLEGVESPFTAVRHYEYDDLEHARREIAAIGERIRREGLPPAVRPLVCGFSGYGNVSQGAQEIFNLLPIRTLSPGALTSGTPLDPAGLYSVVFREEDMVARADGAGPFELKHYYQHPECYRPDFERFLPHLTLLVNCIYWEPKYPRLVTAGQLRQLWSGPAAPHLRVIADISCDIDGSVECTRHATEPGDPAYVYEPLTGQIRPGLEGNGPAVLAVDILPCELPVDASTYFGQTLEPFIPALARADFSQPLERCGLPPELVRATIVYRGELTEPYRYLAEHAK